MDTLDCSALVDFDGIVQGLIILTFCTILFLLHVRLGRDVCSLMYSTDRGMDATKLEIRYDADMMYI